MEMAFWIKTKSIIWFLTLSDSPKQTLKVCSCWILLFTEYFDKIGQPDVSFEKIAFATTQDLFNTIDLNHDEKISIDEFLIWYQTSGGEIDTEELERAKALREAKMRELAKRGAAPPPKRDVMNSNRLLCFKKYYSRKPKQKLKL